MSTPDILSLRWNNHKTTFLKLLSAIHVKSQFEDATVACSGKLFPVHRLVLSCCSNYFGQMFAQTQGKHSIIVLKDISAEVFESLLSYMYNGEAEVKKDLLSDLLVAAHALEIKGLAILDDEDLSQKSSISTSASKEKNILKTASEFPRKRPFEENHQEYSAKIQKLGDNTLSPSNCQNRSLLASITSNNDATSSSAYQNQCSTLCPMSSSTETEHNNEGSELFNSVDDQDGLIEIKEEMYEQQHNTDEISFTTTSVMGGKGSNNVQANQSSDSYQLVNMSQVSPAALMVSCSRAIPNNHLRNPSVSIPPDWNPSKQIPLFNKNSTLEVFLTRSRLGSVLTEVYHVRKDFTPAERSKLVALIIDGLLERFDSLQNCHLEKIAEDLVHVFPTEVKETYYVGPCPEEGKKIARGKLVDRYRNQSRWRKMKMAAGTSLINKSMTS